MLSRFRFSWPSSPPPQPSSPLPEPKPPPESSPLNSRLPRQQPTILALMGPCTFANGLSGVQCDCQVGRCTSSLTDLAMAHCDTCGHLLSVHDTYAATSTPQAFTPQAPPPPSLAQSTGLSPLLAQKFRLQQLTYHSCLLYASQDPRHSPKRPRSRLICCANCVLRLHIRRTPRLPPDSLLFTWPCR